MWAIKGVIIITFTSIAVSYICNLPLVLLIELIVVVNLCFTSLFGTKGILSDIIIR